jgi:hypothetical protein
MILCTAVHGRGRLQVGSDAESRLCRCYADGDLDERDALLNVLGLQFYRAPVASLWGTEVIRRYLADFQHGMTAAGWKANSFTVTG